MPVSPTGSTEDGHIPSPWTVSYSIFSLFVFEDQQVDLHPETCSFPHWLVTFSGDSHHGLLLGTLITPSIRTPTSKRGWATREVFRKLLFFLLSTSSTTLTSMLGIGASSLRSAITCITISHFPIGGFFFQASHPLFNVVCCGGGPGCFHHSLGNPGLLPSLSFLPWQDPQ